MIYSVALVSGIQQSVSATRVRSVMSNSLQSPWTVADQAPLSMGLSRQDYWSRLPFPPPGDLPNPGIELAAPAAPAWAGGFFTTAPPGKHEKTQAQRGKVFGGKLSPAFSRAEPALNPSLPAAKPLFFLHHTDFCVTSGNQIKHRKER